MADKVCTTCGRPFAWRAKWARVWQEVQTCSAACKRGPGAMGQALEQALQDLVARRSAGKTACPSEAVMALYGDKDQWPKDVLRHMRYAVNRLAATGALVVSQRGRVVDAASAKGPLRVHKGPGPRH